MRERVSERVSERVKVGKTNKNLRMMRRFGQFFRSFVLSIPCLSLSGPVSVNAKH